MAEKIQNALYLVATPIGNLADITLRAIHILKSVDLIAAEDTRHTGKLLQHLQITTPQISYHKHNQQQRLLELLKQLQAGKSVALVSDAGMPGICDPGYELVRACIEANIIIVPIPGATAGIAALVASGLPTNRFVFEGFLPVKGEQRKERLQALVRETCTCILYESPHRLRQTLADLGAVLGEERSIVLARELTKLHEEFWRGKITDAIALYSQQRQPKGEYTLIIAGQQPSAATLSDAEIKAELQQLLAQGITRSQACRQLAQLTNLPRRHIYQLSLE